LDDVKEATRDLLAKKFEYVQEQLGDGPYLLGDHFTLPDAYLFVILNWTGMHDIDLARWSGLTSYQQRVAQRPRVAETLGAEGFR
jgi:glutathione S-transferase